MLERLALSMTFQQSNNKALGAQALFYENLQSMRNIFFVLLERLTLDHSTVVVHPLVICPPSHL